MASKNSYAFIDSLYERIKYIKYQKLKLDNKLYCFLFYDFVYIYMYSKYNNLTLWTRIIWMHIITICDYVISVKVQILNTIRKDSALCP